MFKMVFSNSRISAQMKFNKTKTNPSFIPGGNALCDSAVGRNIEIWEATLEDAFLKSRKKFSAELHPIL
jgi:hypothetical protein